ncbi:hypothetical protein QBC46DRAFT_267245 [Diplogelasinospora grovesii]|uniref:Mitochondrial adapter protein MCP1 transmembrane domain-containing protein n=1 Tax=Diplogelasinospora grovesii TaxID=303347 RepID=A0AAN6N1S6_9PEZI|nr:hypothetical protein QBC46DRAFT_267245 [Diplogelasinospora grovesii]
MEPRSPRSKASQDTLISLLQLDPLPIDLEEPDTDKELPPLPAGEAAVDLTTASRAPTTTTSVGLSGSGGHGAIYYLTRIQRYSSYAFSIFAALHVATTSVIPLVAGSVPASESYLLLAREVYQTSVSEPLLVGLPIVAHVGSGIALRLLRRSHNVRRYGGTTSRQQTRGQNVRGPWQWPSYSYSYSRSFSYIALSGYGFAAALVSHVAMNRGLPLAVEGDSANIGLAYVAHGFARHPTISWLAYAALLGLGCGHMIWGWARWLGLAQRAGWHLGHPPTGNAGLDKQVRRRRRRMLLLINAAAAAATAVWAAGGLGIVARGGPQLGWLGKLYDGLYDSVPKF